MRNKLLVLASSTVIAGALLMAGTAFAQTPSNNPQGGGRGSWSGSGHAPMGGMRMMPGVFGTVSAINGDTLTLTSKGFGTGANAAAKTYTVDATNATVFKSGATSTLASVAVGDMVMAAGTLNGTSLTATSIRDGFAAGMGMGGKGIKPGMHASSTPMMQGNGQPVVGGTVSAVNGNTITVTTAQGGATYSIDVTNATITKNNAAGTVASIVVGDKLVVQGAVNGSSVTASTVVDNGAASTSSTGAPAMFKGGIGKVFGSIGGFFHSLFGFF